MKKTSMQESRLSVLIVDNDHDLAGLVREIAEFNGMRAKAVPNDTQVFNRLETEHFDVALVDIYATYNYGLELVRHIKTNPRFAHMRVLIYSAAPVNPGTLQEYGADAFLPKPFDMNDLVNHLKHGTGVTA